MNKDDFDGLDLGLVDGDLAKVITKGLRKGVELSVKIEPTTSDILESRIEGNGTFFGTAFGIAQLIKTAAGNKGLRQHATGDPIFQGHDEKIKEALIVLVAALIGVNVEVVNSVFSEESESTEDMSKYKEI